MSDPQTMGAYLRNARRARRVSIERAADDTKIRADYLMRMESDEFDFLAPAYVRGFLKTYARYLRVDPDPLIHEFERRFGTGRSETPLLLAQGGRRSAPPQPRKGKSWFVAAVGAFVVIVALGIVGLVADRDDGPARSADAPAPLATAAPTPEETATPEVTATPEETPAEDALALDDGMEVTIDAVRADCWVDVTADGVTLFSDTIPLGESQSFSAGKSMTIVFGFPEGVDFVVNGQNLGPPGGPNPITIKLPDDIDSL